MSSVGCSPLMIAALLYRRTTFGLLIVRGFWLSINRRNPRFKRQTFPRTLGISILGGMVGPICLVRGYSAACGISSLLLKLEAVFTFVDRGWLIGVNTSAARADRLPFEILSGAVLLTDSSLTVPPCRARC